MPLTRVAFNTSGTYTAAYYVILNPSSLELNWNKEHAASRTLDGSFVIQNTYYDARPYIMRWTNIRSDYPGFTSMLSTLKGYQGTQKYVNFGTADYASLGWKKVRVGNVSVNISKGGAIKYDSVEIILYPEP